MVRSENDPAHRLVVREVGEAVGTLDLGSGEGANHRVHGPGHEKSTGEARRRFAREVGIEVGTK